MFLCFDLFVVSCLVLSCCVFFVSFCFVLLYFVLFFALLCFVFFLSFFLSVFLVFSLSLSLFRCSFFFLFVNFFFCSSPCGCCCVPVVVLAVVSDCSVFCACSCPCSSCACFASCTVAVWLWLFVLGWLVGYCCRLGESKQIRIYRTSRKMVLILKLLRSRDAFFLTGVSAEKVREKFLENSKVSGPPKIHIAYTALKMKDNILQRCEMLLGPYHQRPSNVEFQLVCGIATMMRCNFVKLKEPGAPSTGRKTIQLSVVCNVYSWWQMHCLRQFFVSACISIENPTFMPPLSMSNTLKHNAVVWGPGQQHELNQCKHRSSLKSPCKSSARITTSPSSLRWTFRHSSITLSSLGVVFLSVIDFNHRPRVPLPFVERSLKGYHNYVT